MFDNYKYTIERTCFKLLIISHYNVFSSSIFYI